MVNDFQQHSLSPSLPVQVKQRSWCQLGSKAEVVSKDQNKEGAHICILAN
jgi:hypothetical protein